MTRQQARAFPVLALTLAFALAGRASADVKTADGGNAPQAAKHDSAAAKHDTPEVPNILEPEPSLMLWTVIVFLGLLGILTKFAWKPMMKALHDREVYLEHCLHEAETARSEAAKLLAENQKQIASAQDQVRAMLEAARRDAEASAAAIAQKAQAEAEATLQRAKREIENERDQALAQIFDKTADLAVAVAGKVLKRTLNADDQRRLIDSAMAELPALANANGVGGVA
jgi:F-type H+-transporting ATPase subunit b